MPDRHGNYSWYDTPDGQDSHKKAFYISKWAAKLGLLTGTIDALVIRAPKTKLGVALVYGQNIGFFVSCGLGYTSGAAISQDLRGKDDETNHVMGAVCASGIAAAWWSSPWLFAYLACMSSPMVYTLKTYQMQGANLFAFNVPRTYPSPSPMSHTKEYDFRSDTLQRIYDEKNEEYWRKRREGTSV